MNDGTNSPQALTSQLNKLLPVGKISSEPGRLATSRANPLYPPGQRPTCIVQPANIDELQAIINFANETGLNLTITSSTGVHRNGGITNNEQNVLIDLAHWRKIDLIDRRNRVCRVEPGVSYGQLMDALAKEGLTLPIPLAPRSGKSVLAAVMDRQPSTWPNKQWDAGDPVGSTEFFFGNGERFRSGAAGGPGTIAQQRQAGGAQKYPSGPSQTDFHRVVQGAQGTMALLTWITLRCELMPTVQKTLLVGSTHLADLLPFVYAVQRGLLGEHSFILDKTAVAMLLSDDDPQFSATVQSACPSFLCLQNVAGFERLPAERLTYHLQDIRGFAKEQDLILDEQIGPISASALLKKATQPCGEIDWRDNQRGSSFSIFFICTLNRTPAFRELFLQTAGEFGIPEVGIGTYIQPIVQNHGCHMEFIMPFDSDSATEIDRMQQFERQAVLRLLEAGAFFSRPYGTAAELVWNQNPANTQLVKSIKGIFDPNRVLQRGKWAL